jgi:TetR/AcrR family transcriptional regulator, transcriptional repressor for nem operon
MYIIQSTDMRYEPEHKTQTRDRIVRKTASKLRAEGLNGPGVASVMKASGLTVGGFYKHFRSKDELFAEAIAQAFSDSEKVYSSLQNVPREDKWKEVVRRYLSPEHCDHPETGCPVAALAPEIARAKFSVRKRVSGLMKERTNRWVEFMPGRTAGDREQSFLVIFSAMAGAVSVARMLTEPAERQKLLATVQDYLLHSF